MPKSETEHLISVCIPVPERATTTLAWYKQAFPQCSCGWTGTAHEYAYQAGNAARRHVKQMALHPSLRDEE